MIQQSVIRKERWRFSLIVRMEIYTPQRLMTKKDSEKEAERPHYYSQFWLDVAAGRRVIGTKPGDEGELLEPETVELTPLRRAGFDGQAETPYAAAVSAPPVIEPAITLDKLIEPVNMIDTHDVEEELDLEDVDVEDTDIPDMDFSLEEEEEEVEEEEKEDLFAEEEEEVEEEEGEEDIGWSGRGRKKVKPVRPVKPPKRLPPTKREGGGGRRGY